MENMLMATKLIGNPMSRKLIQKMKKPKEN